MHRIGHAQPRHDHAQPPAAEAADGHLVLDLAQPPSSARAFGAQDADVVELLQQQRLVLVAHGVVRFERGELVRKLPTDIKR